MQPTSHNPHSSSNPSSSDAAEAMAGGSNNQERTGNVGSKVYWDQIVNEAVDIWNEKANRNGYIVRMMKLIEDMSSTHSNSVAVALIVNELKIKWAETLDADVEFDDFLDEFKRRVFHCLSDTALNMLKLEPSNYATPEKKVNLIILLVLSRLLFSLELINRSDRKSQQT